MRRSTLLIFVAAWGEPGNKAAHHQTAHSQVLVKYNKQYTVHPPPCTCTHTHMDTYTHTHTHTTYTHNTHTHTHTPTHTHTHTHLQTHTHTHTHTSTHTHTHRRALASTGSPSTSSSLVMSWSGSTWLVRPPSSLPSAYTLLLESCYGNVVTSQSESQVKM